MPAPIVLDTILATICVFLPVFVWPSDRMFNLKPTRTSLHPTCLGLGGNRSPFPHPSIKGRIGYVGIQSVIFMNSVIMMITGLFGLWNLSFLSVRGTCRAQPCCPRFVSICTILLWDGRGLPRSLVRPVDCRHESQTNRLAAMCTSSRSLGRRVGETGQGRGRGGRTVDGAGVRRFTTQTSFQIPSQRPTDK